MFIITLDDLLQHLFYLISEKTDELFYSNSERKKDLYAAIKLCRSEILAFHEALELMQQQDFVYVEKHYAEIKKRIDEIEIC
jgi:hypothetical protein